MFDFCCFCEINEKIKTIETIKTKIVEFSKISHIDFDAKIEKNELLICLKKKCIR